MCMRFHGNPSNKLLINFKSWVRHCSHKKKHCDSDLCDGVCTSIMSFHYLHSSSLLKFQSQKLAPIVTFLNIEFNFKLPKSVAHDLQVGITKGFLKFHYEVKMSVMWERQEVLSGVSL